MELPADLVDQIAQAPQEITPYLVAADFLQQHGDPWGELIAVAHAHDRAADPATWRAELERCQRAVMAGDFDAASKHYRVDWHRGVVHRIVYNARTPRASATELRDLLASPTARLVHEIVVVDLGAGLAPMLAEILAARIPALRSLRLISDAGRDRLALGALADRFRYLERLQLDGRIVGALGHPTLRTLELRAAQPDLVYEQLPQLARLAWPADAELEALANHPQRFPALRALELTCSSGDAYFEALVMRSPLGAALAQLELRVVASRGTIVDRRLVMNDHDVPSSSRAALISISGSHRVTVQPIHAPFTIGSHRDASLVLAGPEVAAHQATLEGFRDGWLLRDHGTALATRLGGVRVERARLCSGDELAIGLDRYRFVELGDDPAARDAAIASIVAEG